jgi:hypothetical protein
MLFRAKVLAPRNMKVHLLGGMQHLEPFLEMKRKNIFATIHSLMHHSIFRVAWGDCQFNQGILAEGEGPVQVSLLY